MTIRVITDKGMYVFDEAKELFIEETSLNIHQGSEDDYGSNGWIIEGNEDHDTN